MSVTLRCNLCNRVVLIEDINEAGVCLSCEKLQDNYHEERLDEVLEDEENN